MPLITYNPTNNQTPDATLGGSAVTSPSNTGHGLTQAISSGGGSVSESIRWFGVPAVGGQMQSATLKIGYNITGSRSGPGGTGGNGYTLSYSLNGGAGWTNVVSKTNFFSSESGTISVALSVTQDLTQVQVREKSSASTGDVSDNAEMDSTTSGVRIEVVTYNAQAIVMM